MPFDILRQKSSLNSIQIALEEVAFVPAKHLVQLLIFLGQCDVCDHACIRIHTQRDAGFVEGVDRMVRVALIEIDLHIGGRAYFEVDAFFAQEFNQSRVLNAAHTMSNTRRAQVFQRLPHSLCSPRLASMHSAGNPLLRRVLEGGNMRVNGEARFVGPQVDACNRSEEHTSELQSHSDLVCRLLLEKKKSYR